MQMSPHGSFFKSMRIKLLYYSSAIEPLRTYTDINMFSNGIIVFPSFVDTVNFYGGNNDRAVWNIFSPDRHIRTDTGG